MAYSFRHTNPELAGVLVKEQVRCSKPNCRCVRENRPHKWYYYLYWRDYQINAKLKKRYVPRSEVRKLRQKIRTAKNNDADEKIIWKSYLEQFRQLF